MVRHVHAAMTAPTTSPEPARGTHAQRVFWGATWLLLVQASVLPVGLAVLVYLTRRLGPTDYGQYATVMAVLMWVEFSLSALLNRATVKLVGQSATPRRVAGLVLRVAVGAGTLGMLSLWALAEPLARALDDPMLARTVRLAALDLPLFVTATTYLAAIAGLGQFGRRALAGAFRWPLRLGLALLFVESGYGLHGAIWAVIGSSIAELVACVVVCPLPFWDGNGVPWRQLWVETLPLFGSALSLRILDGADLLMLRAFGASASQAGAYAAAMNLTVLPGLCAGAVFPALMSTMVQLRAEQRPEETVRIGSAVLRVGAWLVPPVAAVALATPALVYLFFGRAYAAAAPLLGILLWAGIARMTITVCAAMLAGAGRSSWAWWVVAPSVPIAMIGYCIWIPRVGALGAAWSTMIASALSVVLSLAMLSSRLDITVPRRTLCWIGLTTTATVGMAWSWPLPGMWAFAHVGLTCLLTVGIATLNGDLPLTRLGVRLFSPAATPDVRA